MSEQMNFDVVIVGAGPAGLSAAIKLKQLANQQNKNLSVCILEKGAEVGSHILSGCVFNPIALDELIPHWRELSPPIETKVTKDQFLFLTKNKALHLPTPKTMHNHGNYIISLGKLCRWLAEYAMAQGVEIFPGFAATKLLINPQNQVYGVATNSVGIDKNGNQTERYQPGIELHAKQVLLSEGCRGSLSKFAINHFQLNETAQAQTYALGVKEIWQIAPEFHQQGLVQHSIGWPLDNKTYGGSFIYHMTGHKILVGFVVGLDYQNPYLSPFKEMQRFKTHPLFKPMFASGKRLSYGARSLVEGGYQSLPKASFPGGMLIGDSAGFLNVPQIKGSHMAMKSGMLAADAILANIDKQKQISYHNLFENSWLKDELYKARNIRPGFQKGLWLGLANAAIDTYLFNGKAPWTLKHHGKDNSALKTREQVTKIEYPKPDGKVSFDLPSSLYLANVFHEENQPCHLHLKDKNIPINNNLKLYDAPEQYYCPAGVYEIIYNDNKPSLQINAQNCIHCKTCDIKDPTQNINWVPPEGGGGPNYEEM